MKKLFTLFFLVLAISLSAQHKIGVRAGLNYSTLSSSELEKGEEIGVSTGFHFGINYTYQVVPNFGVRAELLYLQRGYNYMFTDTIDGVYRNIRPIPTASTTAVLKDPFVEIGKTEVTMDISNGYLSIPITAQYQLTPKWEIFGGASFDFLINPTGRGRVDFTSNDRPDEIFFRQSFDHHYRGDTIGEVNFITGRGGTASIILDGESTNIYKVETAYYHLGSDDKNGNKFKLVDMHAIFGVNYFLNRGFYVGLRGHYGLFDITNDEMDFSVRSLDEDGGYIKRKDRDRSISIGASFGFRF